MDPTPTTSQLPRKRARRDLEDFGKSRDKDLLCQKHSNKYEFWAKDNNMFYCNICVAENPLVKFEVFENFVPHIRKVLAAEVPERKEKVEQDLKSLNSNHSKLLRKRERVGEIIKAVETLYDDITQDIEQNENFISKLVGSLTDIEIQEKKINNIKDPADLSGAVECKSILEKVVASFSVTSPVHLQTLLYNMEGAGTGNPPFRESNVNSLLKGSSIGPVTEAAKPSEASSSRPLPSTTSNSAEAPSEAVRGSELKAGQEWTVDNNNYKAVLEKLAHKKPSVLHLVARDDARKVLKVSALVKAAKDCKVTARFVDTFYKATNTATDEKRLRSLTSNQSLHLYEFYGHLDQENITKLPHSIRVVGLAIGRAADAAAVCGLHPWDELKGICVSIISPIAAEDLKPLPGVQEKRLFFPNLTSNNWESVKPAIKALVPDLRFSHLFFPKCKLKGSDLRLLIVGLRGMKIDRVTIEASNTLVSKKDMDNVEAEFIDAVSCLEVPWDMNWISP